MTEEGKPNITRPVQHKKCSIRLYNVLFPAWMFYLIPTGLWFIILPANFAIDSMVLFLAMRRLGIAGRNAVWKHSIFRIWIFGFLADMLGAIMTLGLFLLIDAAHLPWDVYLFPGTTLLAVPGVMLSAFLIYLLDKRYAFAQCTLSQEHIKRLSLALSIFTAPYAMLIPLYG